MFILLPRLVVADHDWVVSIKSVFTIASAYRPVPKPDAAAVAAPATDCAKAVVAVANAQYYI